MRPRAFLLYFACFTFRYVRSFPKDWQRNLGNPSWNRSEKHLPPLDNGSSTSGMCVRLNAKQGRCEYMNKCFVDEYASNFELATRYACTIDQEYLGVCCPNRPIETLEQSSLGQNLGDLLPIIAVSVIDKTPVNSIEVALNESRIVWKNENSDVGNKYSEERTRGCGISPKTENRLVNSEPADPKEWPWMAALLRKDRDQYCGGVLVTDRHVLTAAHCVYKLKPQDILIRLGEYDFESAEETRTLDFAVSEIRLHKDFDYISYENDIAITKMHRPTVFNSYIWPICLPPINQTFEKKNAVVIGWGTRYYGGPASTVLMQVQVPIWPQAKCIPNFVQKIEKTVMCAGAYEGGRDACQGDSGGPLLHRLDNGRWVNVGIVSWGIRCGEATLPGVYTRVNSYLDWIFENCVF